MNKCINKLIDILFLINAVIHIEKFITKKNINFENFDNYIPYTNEKYILEQKKYNQLSKRLFYIHNVL